MPETRFELIENIIAHRYLFGNWRDQQDGLMDDICYLLNFEEVAYERRAVGNVIRRGLIRASELQGITITRTDITRLKENIIRCVERRFLRV